MASNRCRTIDSPSFVVSFFLSSSFFHFIYTAAAAGGYIYISFPFYIFCHWTGKEATAEWEEGNGVNKVKKRRGKSRLC